MTFTFSNDQTSKSLLIPLATAAGYTDDINSFLIRLKSVENMQEIVEMLQVFVNTQMTVNVEDKISFQFTPTEIKISNSYLDFVLKGGSIVWN